MVGVVAPEFTGIHGFLEIYNTIFFLVKREFRGYPFVLFITFFIAAIVQERSL